MSIKASLWYDQALFILLLVILSGCNRSANELPVVPPATHPLTRDFIGFGVVNVSFTHFFDEPGAKGVSQGYLRKGTVVRISERCTIVNTELSGAESNSAGNTELWVLVESIESRGSGSETWGSRTESRGWLLESALEIFDNEARAITSSRVMNQ